jgi:hypothetical protein
MSWAVTAIVIAAGSAVASAYGTYQQGKTQKEMAQYNADIAEQEAQDARRRGDEEANKVRKANAALAGQQRASFAAKGLDFSEGSAGEALDQTEFFSQQDQATARTNAARAAWSSRAQKRGYEFEAASQRPGMNAGISLLGGASQVAGQWSGYKNPKKG